MLTPPCSALAPSSQLQGSVPPPSRGPWPLPPRVCNFLSPKVTSPPLPFLLAFQVLSCHPLPDARFTPVFLHAGLPFPAHQEDAHPSTPRSLLPLAVPAVTNRPHFGLGWDGEHKGGSVVLLADTCTFGDCSNAGDGA